MTDDKPIKIVYGMNDLRANEKRATMGEAIDKNQVRFWGIKQIDKRLLEKKKKDKKDKNTRPQVIKQMYTYRRQLTKLLKEKKEITAPKRLEAIQTRLTKILPLYKAVLKKFDEFEKERLSKQDDLTQSEEEPKKPEPKKPAKKPAKKPKEHDD